MALNYWGWRMNLYLKTFSIYLCNKQFIGGLRFIICRLINKCWNLINEFIFNIACIDGKFLRVCRIFDNCAVEWKSRRKPSNFKLC